MFESPIDLNIHLKAPQGPYCVVLPIYKGCIDGGCHIIVRVNRANANAMQYRLVRENNRETTPTSTSTEATTTATTVASVAIATSTPLEVKVQEATTTPLPRTRRNKRAIVNKTSGKRSRRSA